MEKVKKLEPISSGTMVECDDGKKRPVVTREEAIEIGTNRYFTGIECQNGHMAERKVKGYVCTVCARIRQKARHKKRLEEDPDYKAKIAAKRSAKHKQRYQEDPKYREKVLARAKVRRQKAAINKKLAQAEAEVTAEA